MLVFPAWRSDLPRDGCRVPRWMPAERFAPYFARTVALPPHPPQVRFFFKKKKILLFCKQNLLVIFFFANCFIMNCLCSWKTMIRPVDRPLTEHLLTRLRMRRECASGEGAARTSRAWHVSRRTSHAHTRLHTEMDSSTAGGRDAQDHKEDSMHGKCPTNLT